MSAEITSTLLPATTTVATDNPGLGTLIALPREIRDEIYRYVVRKTCYFVQTESDTGKAKWIIVEREPDFAMFFLSKVVHKEATSIFYSDSVFRSYLRMISRPAVTFPVPAFDRIMNMEWDIGFMDLPGRLYDKSPIENRLETLLDLVASQGSLRNRLRLAFHLRSPDIPERFFSHLQKVSKAFVGFRMVVIETAIWFSMKEGLKDECEPIARTMEKDMEPTMGPATVSFTGRVFLLKFHPLEYMQSTLRA